MNEKQISESSFSAGEIDVARLTTEELLANPGLLDGFRPCPGCDTVFVLRGECVNCVRMWAQFEERQRPQQPDRIDTGVAPFELHPPYDPGKPASALGVVLVFASVVFTSMCVVVGLWYGFRAVIDFCLRHS